MFFLSTYARTLTKSATEPTYYSDILRTKARFSIKFFLASSLLLAFLEAGWFGLHELPTTLADISTLTQSEIMKLPAQTVVQYNQGTISTKGIALPYTIRTHDWTLNVSAQSLTVASSIDETMNQTMQWKDVWDSPWTLTKNQLNGKRSELLHTLNHWAPVAILASVPFLGLVSIIGNLVTLFILGIFANTMGWLLGVHLTLAKTLQLGLHAIVVASMIDFVRQLLIPTSTFSLNIPAFLGIMLMVLLTLRSSARAR